MGLVKTRRLMAMHPPSPRLWWTGQRAIRLRQGYGGLKAGLKSRPPKVTPPPRSLRQLPPHFAKSGGNHGGEVSGTDPVKIRAKAKSPEGEHLDTITSRDVADSSSSGEQARNVPQPDAEVKGGRKEKESFGDRSCKDPGVQEPAGTRRACPHEGRRRSRPAMWLLHTTGCLFPHLYKCGNEIWYNSRHENRTQADIVEDGAGVGEPRPPKPHAPRVNLEWCEGRG